MKNLRRMNQEPIYSSHLGFEFVRKDEPFDFCIRVLGAAIGKLAFFDEPKTTTLQVKAHDEREIEIRQLFESLEIQATDMDHSVSIPYIDKADLISKLEKITGTQRPNEIEFIPAAPRRTQKVLSIEARPTFTELGENVPEIGSETLELMSRLHHEFIQSMTKEEFQRYSLNVAKEADNSNPNARSIDEHFIIISEALSRAKKSILETVIAIKNARDDLGKTLFQGELAFRLGMHRTTLNRWLSIAESASITLFQHQVPNTFSGLYGVSQIEKTIHEISNTEEDAIKTIISLFEEEKIRPNSEQKELSLINNSLKGGVPIDKTSLVLPENVQILSSKMKGDAQAFNQKALEALRPIVQEFLQEHFPGAFGKNHSELSPEDIVGLAAKTSTSDDFFWSCVGLCFAELSNGLESGELPEELRFKTNSSQIVRNRMLQTDQTKSIAQKIGWI